MSDEIKNDEVKADEVKADAANADEVKADEVKAEDAKADDAKAGDKKDVADVIKGHVGELREGLSSLLNRASVSLSAVAEKATELGSVVAGKTKEKVEEAKDFIDDKKREKEANEIYRKLGMKVYKLNKRGELALPEECLQFVEQLDDVLDNDNDDKADSEA